MSIDGQQVLDVRFQLRKFGLAQWLTTSLLPAGVGQRARSPDSLSAIVVILMKTDCICETLEQPTSGEQRQTDDPDGGVEIPTIIQQLPLASLASGDRRLTNGQAPTNVTTYLISVWSLENSRESQANPVPVGIER